MRRLIARPAAAGALSALIVLGACLGASAQMPDAEPVVHIKLLADRAPVVAGEPLALAAEVVIEPGWHVNSHEPGDDFLIPTAVEWTLPDGWPAAEPQYPPGTKIRFPFAEEPLDVWEHEVVIVSSLVVPEQTIGLVTLHATLTAQACNSIQCLAPEELRARLELEVAAPGSASEMVHQKLFGAPAATAATATATKGSSTTGASASQQAQADRLASLPRPLLFLTVLLAGLALNLLPCVYPLIPITIGFFTQQGSERVGRTLALAVSYVLGMAVTYSALGAIAALTGQVFGSALGNPIVILVIVAVMLALATSMFGLWELRVPGWAMRASGGRGGLLGALVMGLVVGFVAAPCIGPFVLGLLTFVGQTGSVLLGVGLFFTLSVGLGIPYLVLGTFTGMISQMPAAGGWMVGIRKAFGVLLLAMAVYFAGPLVGDQLEAWTMALILIGGGLYLLVIDRTGNEVAAIDRIMRVIALVLVIAGAVVLPFVSIGGPVDDGWQAFDATAVEAAIESGQPVIIDYAADWCIPCRELENITFADPRVAEILGSFVRFKSDQTLMTKEATAQAAAQDVRGVPTVIVFAKGREAFRLVGFEGPEEFLERLKGL